MKKLLIFFLIFLVVTPVFARGGSSFSGGFRGSSFSSSSFRSSVSSGTGWGRSSAFSSSSFGRSYSSPRSYYSPSYRSSNTTIINHGYGGYGGSGFWSGLLGGYIGGSLANHPAYVAAAPVAYPVQQQGYVDPNAMQQPYVSPFYYVGQFIHFILICAFIIFIFLLIRFFWRRA